MSAPQPVKLGSANTTGFIFQNGSSITTSTSGIQSCSVKALFPDGSTVFSHIPAAGTSFATVFGNAYLPATFLVDYTSSGPQIDYLEGRVAQVTFNFKRPDPNAGTTPGAPPGQNGRQVFVDSVFNYKSVLGQLGAPIGAAPVSGTIQEGIYGFAEPVSTVKYNTANPPSIGSGSLASIYAQPGDPRTAGFPSINTITIPFKYSITQSNIQVVGGTYTITYLDGSGTFTTTNQTTAFSLNYNILLIPNPLGWQLTRLKYDPVSGATTYDVEEDWRNFYFLDGSQFVSLTHP